jgi:hypothetical protein
MFLRSNHGTGVTIHDIRKTPDGRVEFTAWLSVLWIPLIPISSCSGLYVGEQPGDGIFDDGPSFACLERIPHDWIGIFQTFARTIVTVAIALAPSAYLIYRTQGRAATPIEMIFVIAAAAWPVFIIIGLHRWRREKLQSP